MSPLVRARAAAWRRLVGLALLACVGLSSVEVAWADAPADDGAPSAADGLPPAADAPSPPDADGEADCPCLCACACANAQPVTPPLGAASAREPGRPRRAAVRGQPAPLSVVAPPHLRPPIA